MSFFDYRVLVAVGEQAQLFPLLAFACALAQEARGAVTLLYVTPDGERLQRPVGLALSAVPIMRLDLSE